MACHKYSCTELHTQTFATFGEHSRLSNNYGRGQTEPTDKVDGCLKHAISICKVSKTQTTPLVKLWLFKTRPLCKSCKINCYSWAKPSRRRAWAHLFVFPPYTHAICKWSHRIIRNTTFFFCMWLHLAVDQLLQTRSSFQKLKELAGYREGNKYYQEPPRSAPRISVLDGVAGTSFVQPHLHWLRHYNFPATPVPFSVFSLLQASVTNRGACPRR